MSLITCKYEKMLSFILWCSSDKFVFFGNFLAMTWKKFEQKLILLNTREFIKNFFF